MDFIRYIVSFLFIIMTPPVSMLFMLIYWIYCHFSGHLSSKDKDSCYTMTEAEEAELMQIIEDLRNEEKRSR